MATEKLTWGLLCDLNKNHFVDGWRLKREAKVIDTWRWGTIDEYVVERENDNKCFFVEVRISFGDDAPGLESDDMLDLGQEAELREQVVLDWMAVRS